jgi:flavin reductase (DIM6/NTAB) family NADH-FMN oxidoreductase RutF
MEKISEQKIIDLPKRIRVQFVNSLSGFKSANLIGTKNLSGQENLSIASSVTHVGSNPPLLSVIFRSPLVERHSYENIIETNFFTINNIDKYFFREAHQTSARYPRNVSEFEECSIEKEYLDNFHAPFAKQSQIKIALEYAESYTIKKNNCVFLIGQIKAVYYNKKILLDDGSLDLAKSGIVSISGLDTYHCCEKIEQLPHAKET